MARLVTSGGEIQDHPTVNAGSPDGYSGGAAATTTETTVVRSGVASIKCAGTVANTSFRIFPVTFATATSRWVRAWVRFSALPNATKKILAVTAGATLHASVRLTATGALQLWNDRSGAVLQIGSDSAALLAVDTWYRLELQVNVDTATAVGTANDTIELRLGVPEDPPAAGGTSVAASAAVALGNVLPTEIRVGWVDAPGVTSDLFVDDLAVNDATGTKENSWPAPDGVIVLQTAVRRATITGWQTCGATNNDADVAQSLDSPPAGHADLSNHTAPFHQLRTTSSVGTDFHNLQNASYARSGVRGDTRLDKTPSFANVYPIGTGNAVISTETTQTVTSEKRAMQFYMNGTISHVEVYLKKVGTPTDDLVFEVLQGVASGMITTPNGATTVVGPVTVPMASLDTTGSWVRATFDPTPLTAGQGYWLQISRSGVNDAANYAVWAHPTISSGEGTGDHQRAAWKSSTAAYIQFASQLYCLRVFSTSGTGRVLLVQNVACVGSTVTTARNGTFGSGTGTSNSGVPLITAAAFTFPNTIAGAYPTNWKWISSAIVYEPLVVSMDRGPRTHLGRTDAVADVMLSCFEGTLCEFTNPLTPG